MAEPVQDMDLVAYLTAKGVKTWRAKGAEVTANCMYCNEDHKRGKLYLNTETWLHMCHVCTQNGNRRTLLDFYGDVDGFKVEGLDPGKRLRILAEVAELAHEMLLANEPQLEYLVGRGLPAEVILREKLGYVPRNVGISDMIPGRQPRVPGDWTTRDFSNVDMIHAGLINEGGREAFNDSLVIPYWSHGSIVQLRARDSQGAAKYRTLGGDSARLYNADALQQSLDVIVVEGEFDGLILRNALELSGDRGLEATGVVAVSGAGWPEGLVKRLSEVDGRVFAGFDPDDTGKRFAAKLKDELGTKARIIQLPTQGAYSPDWTDLLTPKTEKNPLGGNDWHYVAELLAEADLAGKRLFSIQDAGIKWRQRRAEAPGLKLGFAGMDSILRPGLKPGQVFVPLANTGAGKTVFLSNLAHNLRDAGVLYISLEMTATEVFEHFRRIHKFWFPTATYDEMLLDYAKVAVTEENRLRTGDIEAYIKEYEETRHRRPRVVIIDYLQYFARGFPGNSMYERATNAIMETKAVGKEQEVSIIVPSQVGRTGKPGTPLTLDSARDAGTIEETADFMLSLYRPDMAASIDPTVSAPNISGTVMTQLLKSRHGGVGRTFPLSFSTQSLVMADSFDKYAVSRIDVENSQTRRGIHYDDWRQQVDDAHAQQALETL